VGALGFKPTVRHAHSTEFMNCTRNNLKGKFDPFPCHAQASRYWNLANISMRWAATRVLDGLSLTLPRRERLAWWGPSEPVNQPVLRIPRWPAACPARVSCGIKRNRPAATLPHHQAPAARFAPGVPKKPGPARFAHRWGRTSAFCLLSHSRLPGTRDSRQGSEALEPWVCSASKTATRESSSGGIAGKRVKLRSGP